MVLLSIPPATAMVQAPDFPTQVSSPIGAIDPAVLESAVMADAGLPEGLGLQLPDLEAEIPDVEFERQIDIAWQVCDRFDLQTDIWRGRILRLVRDRERQRGDGRGGGFLNWLKEHEISKSQAYTWIELADSADTLLASQQLDSASVERFSKRAFVETAQAPVEVQQMVAESAQQGNRITRREVRELSDQWTAMTSDLIPAQVREKAAANAIPTRYMAPLVKEMEKLPETHRQALRTEIAENPDVETLKQVTSDARYLARYLESAAQVRCLEESDIDIEMALEEALRLGALNLTADLMTQAARVEQTIAKLYTTWKRVGDLAEQLYLASGASTPHLRRLLEALTPLSEETVETQLGSDINCRTIRLTIREDNPSQIPASENEGHDLEL